ncbi:MAG: alpha/beta hydrolase [Planctomycetaceae bacterium]
MIRCEIRRVQTSDGRLLAFRHWQSAGCRGIVLATHGIQSHSGWYEYSSERLASAGFDVYFADRRGSGLNGRGRGHAEHGMQLIHDLRTLRRLAVAEHSTQTPLHLLGLSWGAKIAAATAALFPNECTSLTLLYPGLFPKLRPNWKQSQQLRLARIFEICRPYVPIPLDDPALFTNDSNAQNFIAADPLALHTVSSSLINAGSDLDTIILEKLRLFHRPTLLMLAGHDQIVDNLATKTWLSEQHLPQLTVIEWPAARHTLEFEPNRAEIFDQLIDWLPSNG